MPFKSGQLFSISILPTNSDSAKSWKMTPSIEHWQNVHPRWIIYLPAQSMDGFWVWYKAIEEDGRWIIFGVISLGWNLKLQHLLAFSFSLSNMAIRHALLLLVKDFVIWQCKLDS